MRLACLAAAVFALTLLAQPRPSSRILAVNVDSVVHPVTVEILQHAIDKAQREKADLILIRLNTPGGLVESTRRMVEQIDTSPVPVVTFVTPSGARAASAGFFLLMAGDVAAMSYGTNTGAASPVLMMGGAGDMDPVMRKKVENDAAASLRSQAARRGRNAALAEKAVLEAKSFSDQEALDSHLIDLVVRDEAELLRKLHGFTVTRFDGSQRTLQLESPQVTDYQLSWREKAMQSLSDPNIAFLILIAGALCLSFEFSAPGFGAPGVIGAILLLLGLSAMSLLPINWMAAGLLLVGLACIFLEMKFASHGVLAAGGTLALVLGSLFLVEGPPEMRIRLSTAIGVALPFGIITGLLVTLVVRSRRNKSVTGISGMIDSQGVSVTELSPTGTVRIHGEYWDAISTIPTPAGTPVRVIEWTGTTGLQLKVEPLQQQ
jgi:membrane-bound serine protease (ClpP class)